MRQLHHFVNEYDAVPFDALSYLIGDCNYGGRVTEDNDRKVLVSLLEDFMHPKVLEVGYAYGEDKETQYLFPSGENGYHTYIETIENMPDIELPQIFGFHPNADITKNIKQANDLTKELLHMGEIEGCEPPPPEEENQDEVNPLDDGNALTVNFKSNSKKRPMSARGMQVGKLPEDEQLETICNDILDVLPDTDIDVETVMVLFPTKRENSMNTVLTQEVMRFNKLYDTII